MSSHHHLSDASRPEPDALLEQIADYVLATEAITSREAFDTARLCLMDTLGCGLLALSYPACVKLLGPVVPAQRCQDAAPACPERLTNSSPCRRPSTSAP